MRFETRYDRWLAALTVLAAVVTCVVVPARRLLAPGSQPAPAWLTVTLPQYYEVVESGLFLRQGWRKSLIPYASLVELQPMSDSRSSGVFSTQRILVVTREGKRFLIAVAEEERFLAEVSKRCPQLERRDFGWGIPLAPPTIV
jgi:hypothetical protein